MAGVPVHAPQLPGGRSAKANKAPAQVSPRLRIAGILVRSLFIVLLMIALLHLSMPQSETIWTIFDTPGDVARLALGLTACAWLAVQLFALPRDPSAFRTWLYLGLVAVPFLVICIIGSW